MYWDVTTVKPVDRLTLKVTFIDGLQGTVCFKPSFLTGVFEPITAIPHPRNKFDQLEKTQYNQPQTKATCKE